VLQLKRLKMAMRWAKTWEWAMTGENGQASLNVSQTQTLPRVKAGTSENG
jgi:hypothetical protein